MASEKVEKYDVVIVGAGISGINGAYRVKSQLPNATYTILEARDGIGGTWDLFKYPGIRSDSDLYTFGFSWRPWHEQQCIADGDQIKRYIEESAAVEGIDKHIRFRHRVNEVHWSSEEQAWRADITHDGQTKQIWARFLLFGTGYYDYNNPLPTTIPNLENFKGTIVHPQFWPTDIDYTNKKVAIIGSGATAITLLPNLAKKATKVTMVQRSPGYVIARPQVDKVNAWCHKLLPTWLAAKITRWRFLVLPYLFYAFCRRYPLRARDALKKRTLPQLPKNLSYDPHFSPSYNPWEQRMCLSPDGDFYECLREGATDIVTGHIETVTPDGIVLKDGSKVDADIIVTATGLKMLFAGGTKVFVDGKEEKVNEKFLWKGILLQDIPNAAFVIGYTNASWTLGADAAAQFFVRLITTMDSKSQTSATPRVDGDQDLPEINPIALSSTYVKKGAAAMPKASSVAPWTRKTNYFRDIFNARFGDINTGIQYNHVST